MSLMGVLLDDILQRLNAVKLVLAALVNTVAALFFLVVAHFAWTAVMLLAAGSVLGGRIGAVAGRRLRPAMLRALLVAVGAVAIVQLVFH